MTAEPTTPHPHAADLKRIKQLHRRLWARVAAINDDLSARPILLNRMAKLEDAYLELRWRQEDDNR